MSKIVYFACLAILFTGAADCLAQTGPSADKVQKNTSPGYPVTLGDQTLFYLKDIKGPTGTVYLGEDRAREVSKRIKRIADDPFKSVNSIAVSAYERPFSSIAAENELIMAVLDEDALLEGRTRETLAVAVACLVSGNRHAITPHRKINKPL